MMDSISEKSKPGETPCVYMFKATVTTSTLPVLSPFPNKHPSTASAPAMRPNSTAATPHPASLCGCTEIQTFSLSAMFAQKYSIWSAYTFGEATSTVAGKLNMIGFSTVGSQTALTASQICTANSVGVSLKHSGENSRVHSVSCIVGSSLVNDLTNFVVSIALAMASS